MKRTACLIAGIAVFCLASCGQEPKPDFPYHESSEASGGAEEPPARFGTDNSEMAAVRYQDADYYYLREKADFSALYPDAVVESGRVSLPEGASLIGIDEQGRGFYQVDPTDTENPFRDKSRDRDGEVGVVDFRTNTFEKLLTLPLNSCSGVLAVSDRYIVLQDGDAETCLTRLILFDIPAETEILLYSYTGTKKGPVYPWIISEVLLRDGKVYFDHVTGDTVDLIDISRAAPK